MKFGFTSLENSILAAEYPRGTVSVAMEKTKFQGMRWRDMSCYLDALMVLLHNTIWPRIQSELPPINTLPHHFNTLVFALKMMDDSKFGDAQQYIRDFAVTVNAAPNRTAFGSLLGVIEPVSTLCCLFGCF